MKMLKIFTVISLIIPTLQASWAKEGGQAQQNLMKCFREQFHPTRETFEEIKKQLRAGGPELKAKRESLKSLREKMHENLKSAAASEEQLRQDFISLQNLKQEAALIQFNKFLTLRSHLSAEQKEKFGICQTRAHQK
jgi:Spy/CpxP family protein refolding chaperone